MKFLLDENVPVSLKKIINTLGHKATTLRDENHLGIENGEVAKFSIEKNYSIITLDSDFLSLKKKLQQQCKIIYIKIHPRDPEVIAEIVQKHLNKTIENLSKGTKVILSNKQVKYDPSIS